MAKLNGWQTNLSGIIENYRNTPFKWGRSDCCIFAHDCIEAQVDFNIFKTIPPTYTSEIGAIKYMKKISGATCPIDMMDYLADKHNWNKIEPVKSHKGDVVAITTLYNTIALGIITLNPRRIAIITDEGLVFQDRTDAIQAWNLD